MHLLAISLLTILAGTLLLVKFKKETPGKFFNFIAWFFIVIGFILFIGAIGMGICRMKHNRCCGHPEFRHEMMVKGCDHGMQPGLCGPKVMGKEGCFGPQGMYKGMCFPKPGCMPHDSAMKCCPKHMACDSTKMTAPKKCSGKK